MEECSTITACTWNVGSCAMYDFKSRTVNSKISGYAFYKVSQYGVIQNLGDQRAEY